MSGIWWNLMTEITFHMVKSYRFDEILEGAARYAGLLLAPAEGFGLQPMPFFALRATKRSVYVCFGPNFGHFWYQ